MRICNKLISFKSAVSSSVIDNLCVLFSCFLMVFFVLVLVDRYMKSCQLRKKKRKYVGIWSSSKSTLGAAENTPAKVKVKTKALL